MSPFFNPVYVLAILIAVTIHECAHAFAAKLLGDRTAEFAGRLTLNPLSHLDPMGALMFIIVGFGWAKPVPVDPRYLDHPRRDNALIALAGPASNFVVALIAYVILALLFAANPHTAGDVLGSDGGASVGLRFVSQLCSSILYVNLALMAFNFLPVPPLDGSKIVELFIPWEYRGLYEEFLARGPMILFGLLILEAFLPIRIISVWVHGIMDAVLTLFDMVGSLLL